MLHPRKKIFPFVCVDVRLILVLVWKTLILVLVWGTSERLVPAKNKKNVWYQRALRCQLRGRPFHPWAGRLRFSGAATLTQSSSFSCGAGLHSESRLLLCCAPAVYMLAADYAVAAAFFGLEHLISYRNKKIFLVLVWGTSEHLVPAKKKQNTWYQRALRCQLRGWPFHPWAGRLRFSGEALSLIHI